MQFGDDQAKTNPWSHDRLGFAPVAERIASVLLEMNVPNGYVIGIQGAWGSGKSTMLNFIQAHIRKHNQENQRDQLQVINFRPWMIAGHQDVISAFFKLLAETLDPDGEERKRKRRNFARAVAKPSKAVAETAGIIAMTVDPSGGLGSKFASELAKNSLNDLLGRFLDIPTIQQSYDDLKVGLKKMNKRFLVVIDDIDRLEDDDVRTIMQMVKSVGELPNVTYLLSYDKEIVWSILKQPSNCSSSHFAEKIIQHEIDLPIPKQGFLLKLLDEEIEFILKDIPGSTRWSYIVRDGVRRWIKTPRDVVRLSNAVRFAWFGLGGEVDPQDVLAMEGLRLFEEEVFNWIKSNRDALFDEGFFSVSREKDREPHKAILLGLLGAERNQSINLITTLFPQAAKWLGESDSGLEANAEVRSRRGVGSKAGFDAYFGLHPSSDYVSKIIVDEIEKGDMNTEQLVALLRVYLSTKNSNGRLLIVDLLEELSDRFRLRVSAEGGGALLAALFSVGDEIIALDDPESLFSLSPKGLFQLVVRQILEKPNEGDEQTIVELFEKHQSVFFLSDFFVERGRERGVFGSSKNSDAALSDEVFKQIGKILLKKIQQQADQETLYDAPYYYDIIRVWAYLESSNRPRAWLRSAIRKSAECYRRATIGLLAYTIGENYKKYEFRESEQLSLFDEDELYQLGFAYMNSTILTPEQKSIIEAVVDGLKRKTLFKFSKGVD